MREVSLPPASREMLQEGLIEVAWFTDGRSGREYFMLATPGAFAQSHVGIIAPGLRQPAGLWSKRLVDEGRGDAGSMAAYFREFTRRGWGLVATHPPFLSSNFGALQDQYQAQLQAACQVAPPASRLFLIGFSHGGTHVLNFLASRPGVASRVAGVALLDGVYPRKATNPALNRLLAERALVANGNMGPYGGPLELQVVDLPGRHGEVPARALAPVVAFFLALAQTYP